MKRLMMAIGEPDESAAIPEPKDDEPERRPYKLAAGKHTLEMEQKDFKRLEAYVNSTQWTFIMLEESDELEDRLSAAKEVQVEEPEKKLRKVN